MQLKFKEDNYLFMNSDNNKSQMFVFTHLYFSNDLKLFLNCIYPKYNNISVHDNYKYKIIISHKRYNR